MAVPPAVVNILEGGDDFYRSYCFVCNQLIDDQNEGFDKLEKNLEMCHKFCTLVSRFLNFSCADSLGNFKPRETLDLKSGNEILDLDELMCDGCFYKAEKFCDLYDVWTKAKLELNQSVKDMAALMNVCDSNGTETGKPGFRFRQMFLGQVQNRLNKGYPQLKLDRLPPQQEDIGVKPNLKFSCRFCLRRFKTFRNYKIHHTTAHKYRKHGRIIESGIKPKFSCRTCGKRFRRDMHLKIHARTHTGEFHELERAEVNKMDIREENVENDMIAENEKVVSSPSKHSGSTSKSTTEVQHPTATLNHDADNNNESEPTVNIEHGHEADAAREAGNQVDKDKMQEMQDLRFKCSFCRKRFRTSKNCKIHQTLAHNYSQHGTVTDSGIKKQFSCKTCGRSFLQSIHLKIHERCHTGERPHRCQICDKTWRQASNLKRHLLKFHELEKAEVDKMGVSEYNVQNDMIAVNANISSPSKHSGSRSIAGETETLSIGNSNGKKRKVTTSKNERKKSRQKVSANTQHLRLKCVFCQRRFSTWRNCKIHQTLAHKMRAGSKIPNLIISNYGKTAKTGIAQNPKDKAKSMMSTERKKTTGKKTGKVSSVIGANKKYGGYQTDNRATNSTFMSKYELRERKGKPSNNESEITTANSNPDKNQDSQDNQNLPFKCDSCDKRFRTWRNCKIHKTIVHKKRDKAENSTNEIDEVKHEHVTETENNEEEKEFKCKSCDKTFRHWTSLNFHEREHTAEKRYECELCGKIWTTSENLELHRSTTHGLVEDKTHDKGHGTTIIKEEIK